MVLLSLFLFLECFHALFLQKKKPPKKVVTIQCIIKDSFEVPFECHSNALPGELRPHDSFEFFCRLKLSISSNVGYYTVEFTACQALFWKNAEIFFFSGFPWHRPAVFVLWGAEDCRFQSPCLKVDENKKLSRQRPLASCTGEWPDYRS